VSRQEAAAPGLPGVRDVRRPVGRGAEGEEGEREVAAVRIALDAMGGDFAPRETVKGALQASRRLGVEVVLVGDSRILRERLAEFDASEGQPCPIIHAADSIAMNETGVAAAKRPNTSIAIACEMVKSGDVSCMASVGNTAAVMASALLRIGRIRGVLRPAIACVVPTMTGKAVMVDAGANVDCDSDNLVQFAAMGSIYSEQVLEVTHPRVGLLSVGEEETKGNDLVKRTHKTLLGTDLNFVGNVEGKDIFSGCVDVVVCDGFVGNVVLKVAEGIGEYVMKVLREEVHRSLLRKIPMLMLKGVLRGLRRRMDYAEYGGAPLLGIDGVCVVGHGRSHSKAVANAIRIAKQTVDKNVVDRIAKSDLLKAKAGAA
jgi:glycerol-3-phosphate acyltransferase PlsX